MLRFLYHCFQAVLTLFWSVCILAFIVAFVGIGFSGGMLLACWEDVRGIDLDRLEYDVDVQTWRQHLEVYSSVCEGPGRQIKLRFCLINWNVWNIRRSRKSFQS